MREAMRAKEIKRVTEAQILETALAMGRRAADQAIRFQDKPDKIDSLEAAGHLVIRWLTPEAYGMRDLEREIMDAYLTQGGEHELPDNIQLMGKDADSLMYSKPVTQKWSDSTIVLKGMWSVLIPKKQVVLSID